jgi:hypothetical protein
MFLQPKTIVHSISDFHANVVLLEDGLAIGYHSKTGDGGDTLITVTISVSNFGLVSLAPSATTRLHWGLTSKRGNQSNSEQLTRMVGQGEVTVLKELRLVAPDAGSSHDANSEPIALTLYAELVANGTVCSLHHGFCHQP